MDIQRGNCKFPHCDSEVLHAKKTCKICDKFPELQEHREKQGINFTGENDPNKAPCSATQKRSVSIIHQWKGNVPVDEKYERQQTIWEAQLGQLTAKFDKENK